MRKFLDGQLTNWSGFEIRMVFLFLVYSNETECKRRGGFFFLIHSPHCFVASFFVLIFILTSIKKGLDGDGQGVV